MTEIFVQNSDCKKRIIIRNRHGDTLGITIQQKFNFDC